MHGVDEKWINSMSLVFLVGKLHLPLTPPHGDPALRTADFIWTLQHSHRVSSISTLALHSVCRELSIAHALPGDQKICTRSSKCRCILSWIHPTQLLATKPSACYLVGKKWERRDISLTSIPLLAPIRQPTSAIFCTGSLGDFHASIQHLKHLGRSTKAEQMAPCHPQLHQPCSAEHTCPDAWQMDRYIGYSLNQCHSWLLLADRQKRKASCIDHSNGAIRPYLGTTALC